MVKGNGLNLLINNAGAASRQLLHELTSEQMRHLYDINCVAPLMLAKVGSVRRQDWTMPNAEWACFKFKTSILMRKISCIIPFSVHV